MTTFYEMGNIVVKLLCRLVPFVLQQSFAHNVYQCINEEVAYEHR